MFKAEQDTKMLHAFDEMHNTSKYAILRSWERTNANKETLILQHFLLKNTE